MSNNHFLVKNKSAKSNLLILLKSLSYIFKYLASKFSLEGTKGKAFGPSSHKHRDKK